jgi:Uma2 family endonuclease
VLAFDFVQSILIAIAVPLLRPWRGVILHNGKQVAEGASIMTGVSGSTAEPPELRELHTGDRMNRKEFHRIYETMPADFKAELIGGIVYVASPLKWKHGTRHLALGTVFGNYEGSTPGVDAGDNTTILLGPEGEPQPDLYLRILPEFGGQSGTTKDDYVDGAPELLSEIAHSSRSLDLHGKLRDYRRNGVLEYIVACLRERQLRWFDLSGNKELQLDADGICRIRTFPGLWIHAAALFAKDFTRLLATLNQGLASPEHAAFVRRLQDAKKPRRRPGGKRKRP